MGTDCLLLNFVTLRAVQEHPVNVQKLIFTVSRSYCQTLVLCVPRTGETVIGFLLIGMPDDNEE